jgi:hypothetical protein
MSSILDTPDSKPSTTGSDPGKALAMVGTGLAVVALGVATYLFVELREARKQIARLTEQASSTDKKARELDLGLAAVRGQTATIAERAGVTQAELEKTAAAAQQLRAAQRKGQEQVANLGGEVGKVKDDVAASKAAIEETQARCRARSATWASRAGSSRATRTSSPRSSAPGCGSTTSSTSPRARRRLRSARWPCA